MPRKPTERELYDELLTRYGREIADAFLDAVHAMKRGADLQALITAIRAGNIDQALDALHLDDAVYSPVLEAIRGSFVTGGTLATDNSLLKFRVLFNIRNRRAETWLTETSSRLVTSISQDQRLSVREALKDGLARGENPKTTALNIVGRFNPATKVREGGILGLTSQQAGYVRNARDELLSGDPAQMTNYLGRARRDKRFDRSVLKAIREESPVPAEITAKAARQYESRLLQLRGQTIARTEALNSLRASKREAFLQAVENGAVAEADVRRTWRDVGDLRTRHSHRRLEGQTVGLNEPYRSPDTGALMMHPGDTSLGAPAKEVIGCRCDEDYRIDHLANIR